MTSINDKWDASGETSNKWDGTLEDAQALYEGRKKYCDKTFGSSISHNFEEHCRALQSDGREFMVPRWRRALNPPRPVAMAQALREAQGKIEELEGDLKYQSQATEVYRYASKDTVEKDKKIKELEGDLNWQRERVTWQTREIQRLAGRVERQSGLIGDVRRAISKADEEAK